jgi:diguanylate cyclase (GGDEF)-like protein
MWKKRHGEDPPAITTADRGRLLGRTISLIPWSLVAPMALVSVLAGTGVMTLIAVPAPRSMELAGAVGTSIAFVLTLFFLGDHVLTRARHEPAASTVDPATGLTSPHVASLVLGLEFAAAQRGRLLTVVLVRIDSFPRYAAKQGRDAAERLLWSAGRILRRHTRGMHTTAQHGTGATYMTVLSEIPLQGACVFAKRVRRELMSLPGAGEAHTVSIGVVSFDLSMASPFELLEVAERALSRGTSAGGKIIVAGLPSESEA